MTTSFSMATAVTALLVGVGGATYYFQSQAVAVAQCQVAQIVPAPLVLAEPHRTPAPTPRAFVPMSSAGNHSY